MATLTDDQRAFLRENAFAATATTLREDGSPHNTIVWMSEDDGKVVFNTARGRAKARHLERDARAGLLVVDPANQYRWVAVDGPAELSEEDGDEWIDRLAKKYLDADSYPFRDPSETRVTVRISPEHVSSSGFDS
jgi:PPOX class probable F420-dependent enzyme